MNLSVAGKTFDLALLTLCITLLVAWPSFGQERGGEGDTKRLQQRIQELEKENAELKAKLGKKEEKAPISIQEVENDAPEAEFLKLGEKIDYLRAERYRIIEQIETFIPPLYEPVRPFHAFTIPPGAWRASVSSDVFDNHGDFGSNRFYSLFFNNVKVRNIVANADIFYGFELPYFPDLVLNLNVPYKRTNIKGTGHPFRIDTMVMTMQGDAAGIGDISLTLKEKWLDQGNWYVNLASFLGVIFPTGEHRRQFNDCQTLFNNGAPQGACASTGGPKVDAFGSDNAGNERFIPNGSQPGTGAWGFRLGLAGTRQFERSALHAGVISNLFAKNSDGITPGHEVMWGLSYVFPPLRSDLLTIDLSFFGRWKGDEKFPGLITHPMRDPATGGAIMNPDGTTKMFTTGRPNFKHDAVLFFSPSLIAVPNPQTRLFLSPAVRVVEPDKGPSPKFRINFGISHTFDMRGLFPLF